MKAIVAVWVVRYDHPDFADLDGVFSTKDKAFESVMENVQQHRHYWLGFEKEEEQDNYTIYGFWYDDERIGVTVYKTEIQ